jgi:hypothetical protein
MTDFSSFPLYSKGRSKSPIQIGQWDIGNGLILITEQGTYYGAADRRISIKTPGGRQVSLTEQHVATLLCSILHNESLTRPPPGQQGCIKRLECLEDCMNMGIEAGITRHQARYVKPKKIK